jgi:glutathione S-transferase
MIEVHHLNNSRSHRVLWLLEELLVPYEVVRYQRDPQTMLAPPELKQIHPLGKSPVIRDGDVVLAESAAILEYLLHTYSGHKLVPPQDTKAHLRYLYWLHFAEGSAMPPLLLKLYLSRLGDAAAPVLARVDVQLNGILDFMEADLNGPYFAGEDFSAADIQMSFPLQAAVARAGLNEARPKLWHLLQRISQRDAYRRAEERGGSLKLGK